MSTERPYRDPEHQLNGSKYHTGKPCIERGCGKPAGTAWSPYWCQACNTARMDRIDASLNRLVNESKRRQQEPAMYVRVLPDDSEGGLE